MLSINNPTKSANYELDTISHSSGEFVYIQGERRWVEFTLSGAVEIIQGYYMFSLYNVDKPVEDLSVNVRFFDENGVLISDSLYTDSVIYSHQLYYNTPQFTLVTPKGAHVLRVTSLDVDMKVVFKTRALLKEVR
ncbi:hypothetical protein [Enterovibrio calviensis]|uniref:hypothetical protein n=1 Tax=Enterovibrio calviensis TaxID=91359 RepID=UPI0004845461|nr:hypothetical protein [Enterovibrio calviensis]